jgi:lysophospholipase L1-like esterase
MASIRTRILRTTTYLAYVLIVTVILFEIALRIFDPVGVRYLFESRRYFARMRLDPDFEYIHPPGHRDDFDGVRVTINSEGFRGPEFQPKKPEGRTRILILGDSVLFGWAAPQDSIFPALLQYQFDRTREQVEVIAAGVGSWNTRSQYEFFKKRGIEYGPDVVLLLLLPNDIELNERRGRQLGRVTPKTQAFKRIPVDVMRWITHHSYLLSSVVFLVKKYTVPVEVTTKFSEQSAAWQDARSALEGMIELCRGRDARFIVFLFGNPETDYTKACVTYYGGVLNAAGIPFITLPPELYRTEYRISLADAHPNVAGHRLIAREMARTLKPIIDVHRGVR